MRRVVVTGLGMVSPLGVGVEAAWRRLLDGQSGLAALPEEITEGIAAKVGGDATVGIPSEYVEVVIVKK